MTKLICSNKDYLNVELKRIKDELIANYNPMQIIKKNHTPRPKNEEKPLYNVSIRC